MKGYIWRELWLWLKGTTGMCAMRKFLPRSHFAFGEHRHVLFLFAERSPSSDSSGGNATAFPRESMVVIYVGATHTASCQEHLSKRNFTWLEATALTVAANIIIVQFWYFLVFADPTELIWHQGVWKRKKSFVCTLTRGSASSTASATAPQLLSPVITIGLRGNIIHLWAHP